jgi:hypothetical protein
MSAEVNSIFQEMQMNLIRTLGRWGPALLMMVVIFAFQGNNIALRQPRTELTR